MKAMTLLTCMLACLVVAMAIATPKLNLKATPRQRALALVAKMTSEEKFSLVHGVKGPYVGNTVAIQHLGIPELHLEDGPQGVADGVSKVTAWPSALTVIATWDRDMQMAYGAAMGKEQRIKGTNVMLGPMVNLARIPMGGRNFESYGEDPYLASEMVGPCVKGIQSNGVIATVKHFVDNNQEYHRTTVSANIGERTQFELYYPAFKAAIAAGVGAVMCSYNKINDTWACENEATLTDLKTSLGFDGWVMSDWGATHSAAKAANAGLDQQMPDGSHFGAALQAAVQAGTVKMERIDDMVTRMLTAMYAIGIMDTPQTGDLSVDAQSPAHVNLTRQFAEAATILLKNKLLPLNANTVKSIAVIGDDASDNPIVTGGGSGHVKTPYISTPLAGIQARVSKSVSVSYTNSKSIPAAVAAAKAAEYAIVFVATTSHEGADRASLNLDGNADALVAAVAAAQPNTIVVVHSPGAVVMPWEPAVSTIVAGLMPGQEAGNAIASVLFGDVNPGAKLPLTFPVSESVIPTNTTKQYPGINDQAAYSEGLFIGYRWFEANNIKPLFPFGHGLSYTTFSYSDLKVSGRTVTFTLKNSGTVDGAEVAQLYIAFPASAGEPPQVLRGFTKTTLKAGASTSLSFTLSDADLSFFNVRTHAWELVHGAFGVHVGSSSADIRLMGSMTV